MELAFCFFAAMAKKRDCFVLKPDGLLLLLYSQKK
jgi:hypothetical protein